MSPSKYHQYDENGKKSVAINGRCLSPLMIKRDSHFLQKSSSSNLNSPPPSSPLGLKTPRSPAPVIIYTSHSPRVIRTEPQDFRELVQKLTGLKEGKQSPLPQKQRPLQRTAGAQSASSPTTEKLSSSSSPAKSSRGNNGAGIKNPEADESASMIVPMTTMAAEVNPSNSSQRMTMMMQSLSCVSTPSISPAMMMMMSNPHQNCPAAPNYATGSVLCSPGLLFNYPGC